MQMVEMEVTDFKLEQHGYWFKHPALQILQISIYCNESYCVKGETVRHHLLMAIIFIFASSQLQATRVNVACFGKEDAVLKIKHGLRHLLKVRFARSNACRGVRRTYELASEGNDAIIQRKILHFDGNSNDSTI